jgi:polar amino acid transport system permease protein
MNNLDFSAIAPYIPQMMRASMITLKIGALAFGLALAVSVLVGTLRSNKLPKPLAFSLSAYVEIFRGTPLLVQLFLIYYGMPSFGITLDAFTAAILGLALNSGAYMSEIVRGSILAVDSGQYQAAYSLGYSKTATFRHIILPQAYRIALPPFMNSFSTLLKDTSLVSVLSIAELTRIGNQVYAVTLRPFEIFIILGAFYFAATYSIAILSKYLEKRSSVWVH